MGSGVSVSSGGGGGAAFAYQTRLKELSVQSPVQRPAAVESKQLLCKKHDEVDVPWKRQHPIQLDEYAHSERLGHANSKSVEAM